MAKKQRKKKQLIREESRDNTLFYTALAAFGVLLFYPPFFRGLFFKVEQQWTLLFASLVFLTCCLWRISEKDFRFFRGLQSYAVFGLLLAYVISSFGAADLRLAVAEVVKMGIYFIVFWVAGQFVRNNKALHVILAVLYLSGVCVALAGFLSAVGILDIQDGFVNGRIYSTLQYPNALAIFLAAIAFLGFYYWLVTSPGIKRLGLAAGNFILLFVFVSTNSRGGFLVAAGMAVLYFLCLPVEKKLPWAGHIACIAPLAVLCSGRVIPAAMAESYGTAWGWFLACLALCILIHWFGQRSLTSLGSSIKGINVKRAVALGLICIVVIAGIMLLPGNDTGTPAAAGTGEEQAWYFKVLPEHIAQRVSDITLETQSAALRIYWTLQAFDIVKHSPVFGLGGGAWEASYRMFQDYPYNSTQVHNHFLQLWAEIGTVGFILYAAVWLLFVITCWKIFRSETTLEGKVFGASIFTAGIGLGVHSFIDFDLALSAVAILLWTCFGLVWGKGQNTGEVPDKGGKDTGRQKKGFIAGTAVLTICFLALPVSLLISNAYAKEGVAYAQAGHIQAAERSFMEASRFDPFSADIKATLASLKNAQKDREAAVDYMNAALARSPYDASLYSSLSDIHLTYGEIESAIESGKKAVRCAPWLVSSYESLTNAYVEGGIESLTNGDVDGARKYFSECSSIPQLLNENAEKIPEKAQKLWRDRDKFMALNPAVKLNIGISQIYLGQYGEGEESLKPALENEETKAEASFWQAVLAEKRGQTADAEKYLQQADENLAGQFETLVGLTAVPKE